MENFTYVYDPYDSSGQWGNLNFIKKTKTFIAEIVQNYWFIIPTSLKLCNKDNFIKTAIMDLNSINSEATLSGQESYIG